MSTLTRRNFQSSSVHIVYQNPGFFYTSFPWLVFALTLLITLPSFKLLYLMDEVIDPSLVINGEGHERYWAYQQPDFVYKTEYDALIHEKMVSFFQNGLPRQYENGLQDECIKGARGTGCDYHQGFRFAPHSHWWPNYYSGKFWGERHILYPNYSLLKEYPLSFYTPVALDSEGKPFAVVATWEIPSREVRWCWTASGYEVS